MNEGGRTKKKMLGCLALFLAWALAALAGLFDLLPVPEGFSLPSFGEMLFGRDSHGAINPFLIAADLLAYGLIAYGLVSVIFWLYEQLSGRKVS